MRSTISNSDPLRPAALLAVLVLLALRTVLCAADQPGFLTVVPDSGLIMLDNDTLNLSGPSEIEVQPGDHVLSFYPIQTSDRWTHLYLDYDFNIGSGGKKTLDLTRHATIDLRTDPQSADIEYRGSFLGHTPGEYLFLIGMGDSVVLKLTGYQSKTVRIDQSTDYEKNVFAALEPLNPADNEEQVEVTAYISPLKELLSPDLLISLGSGAALLVTGVHYNRLADASYDRYLHLLGTDAREKAFSQARHNDRISKATFIAGDLAVGAFGFLVIRRVLLSSSDIKAGKHPGLSMDVGPRSASLSLRF
jgi:hypothetical protein